MHLASNGAVVGVKGTGRTARHQHGDPAASKAIRAARRALHYTPLPFTYRRPYGSRSPQRKPLYARVGVSAHARELLSRLFDRKV